MQEYTIDVSAIEELQMINNRQELEQIFTRAKSTIVQGGAVVLARSSPGKSREKFDELTTEPELEAYKEKVFKYL